MVVRRLTQQATLTHWPAVRLDCGLRVRARVLETGELCLALTRELKVAPSESDIEKVKGYADWPNVEVERTKPGGMPTVLVTRVGP